jgi:hypothetical protein
VYVIAFLVSVYVVWKLFVAWIDSNDYSAPTQSTNGIVAPKSASVSGGVNSVEEVPPPPPGPKMPPGFDYQKNPAIPSIRIDLRWQQLVESHSWKFSDKMIRIQNVLHQDPDEFVRRFLLDEYPWLVNDYQNHDYRYLCFQLDRCHDQTRYAPHLAKPFKIANPSKSHWGFLGSTDSLVRIKHGVWEKTTFSYSVSGAGERRRVHSSREHHYLLDGINSVIRVKTTPRPDRDD